MARTAVLALALLALAAAPALAHGGGCFPDRPGGVPPGLRAPNDPEPPPTPEERGEMPHFRFKTSTRVVSRWGDVVRVRVTIRLDTAREPSEEAVLAIAVPPGFLLSKATALVDGERVAAAPAGVDGRRLALAGADRFLAVRVDDDLLRLRVFPVRRASDTRVITEGFAVEPLDRFGARLYRGGERVLVVTRDGWNIVSWDRAARGYPGAPTRDVPGLATALQRHLFAGAVSDPQPKSPVRAPLPAEPPPSSGRTAPGTAGTGRTRPASG